MNCSMAPFINTYSNLFALQATPVKQVKRSPSSANFSVDCITVAVRLFYMETVVNTFFQSIKIRMSCNMAPFIDMHWAGNMQHSTFYQH